MSFATPKAATEALKLGPEAFAGGKQTVTNLKLYELLGNAPTEALCVDAACSGAQGALEYRGVLLPSGKEVFRRGPFPSGTTNIGEFLGIVTGLAWLDNQHSGLPLYSDSAVGIKWVKQKRINTKLPDTAETKPLMEIVEKAIQWLHAHGIKNQIKKWETDAWGEIPADFGRK